MEARHRILALIAFTTILAAISGVARANIILGNGSFSRECTFQANYAWNPVNPPENVQFPGNSALPPRWKATTATVNAAGNIDVSTQITHDDGKDCGGANDKSISLALTAVKPAGNNQVQSKITMGQVTHGTAVDLGYLKTTVQTDNAGKAINSSIIVAGNHPNQGGFPVSASFTNDSKKPISTLVVVPDFAIVNDFTGAVRIADGLPTAFTNLNLQPGAGIPKISLGGPPSIADDEFNLGLASFKITAIGSPGTETDLAFLGASNGVPSELDLGTALDLLLGSSEFFAPYLRPLVGADTLSLFVGIDLSQWVGLDRAFDPSEVFSLTNGVSDDLPGMLVGTSPITLGPNGYETDNRFTGQVVVAGTIDGGVVPEPSSLALVLSGIIGLGMLRRQRLRKLCTAGWGRASASRFAGRRRS